MPTQTIPYPYAALNIGGEKTDISPYATDIVSAIKANPNTFLSSATVLGTLEADIAALATSEAAARNRMPGARAQRTRDRQKVVRGLHHVVDYVQGVAEVQPTAAAAVVVIQTAKLSVKQRPQRQPKQVFAVKDGPISGSVILAALAVARTATYFWEFSGDQKQWSVRNTMQATVTIEGLTPGQTYYFRFRSLTRKKGESDYSQVISYLVR